MGELLSSNMSENGKLVCGWNKEDAKGKKWSSKRLKKESRPKKSEGLCSLRDTGCAGLLTSSDEYDDFCGD